MKIGANLRKYRELAGFERKDAAKMLGVSLSALTHWENDDNGVSSEYLAKMKELYGVTIAEFYGEKPGQPLSKEDKDFAIDKVLELFDLDNVKTVEDLNVHDKAMLDALLNKFIEKKKNSTV